MGLYTISINGLRVEFLLTTHQQVGLGQDPNSAQMGHNQFPIKLKLKIYSIKISANFERLSINTFEDFQNAFGQFNIKKQRLEGKWRHQHTFFPLLRTYAS